MSSNDRISKTLEGYFSRVDTSKPCIGVIKDNRDSERMGRVQVWIQGSTAPENDPSGWIWVSYCSPFAGATPIDTLGGVYSKYEDTQKSYGFWATPPDIDNQVIVVFINGDIRQGYWIGCLYHKNMNQMVPGLGEGAAFQAADPEFSKYSNPSIPVSEYNKLSLNPRQRPYYQPLAEALLKQGLIQDDLRGAGSSSARRESPSKVFGVLTPGGNQFVMDDGEDSSLIRFRTTNGAQILISDTTGSIYIITKDGNNWVEVNNDGYVDIYAAKDISLRSEANINIRADKDVNIESGGTINMRSTGAEGVKVHCTVGDFNLQSGAIYLTSDNDMNLHAKGNLNQLSDDTLSFTSTNNIIFFGTNITSNIVQGNLPTDAITPATVQKLDLDLQIADDGTITLVEQNLDTIMPRLPHHEPWPDHAVALQGTRELVEEGEGTATIGSVSENPAAPLPLVGTPKPGMTEGVYIPKEYKNGQPVYEFAGSTTDLKPVNELALSEQGVSFIARFEGFSSNIYLDAVKKPTIGYGHLIKGGETFPSGGISQEEALDLLAKDAEIASRAIRKYTKVKLTQAQFDALVSFAFNVGNGAFQKSTLLKKLNAGNYAEVPSELMRWNKAGGKVLDGLTRRRREEGLLFSTPAKT